MLVRVTNLETKLSLPGIEPRILRIAFLKVSNEQKASQLLYTNKLLYIVKLRWDGILFIGEIIEKDTFHNWQTKGQTIK